MPNEIMLSDNQLCALKTINRVYEASDHGCKTIDITTDERDLKVLEAYDFIFKTSEGYFPSTFGQEYIKNI